MNTVESQKKDYTSMQGYIEPEEVLKMATCPSTKVEHDLYAAAHCLVSERVSKFDLVNMVYALLKREYAHRDAAEFEARTKRIALNIDIEDVPCAHGMTLFCPAKHFKGQGCGDWCRMRSAHLQAEQEMEESCPKD